MAAEAPEVTRQSIEVRESSRRRWDERLVLRFPAIAYALTRWLTRLSPTSALRRATLRHVWRRVLEAANRGDWEAAFAILPPDYEAHPPADFAALGFGAVYRGREERLQVQRRWMEVLGDFQQEAKELIDLGDRILLLAWMRGTGLGSGVGFEGEWAYLITFRDGRISREDVFRSHSEALEAAGLAAVDRCDDQRERRDSNPRPPA
jgi:ketosteroid isomerase-like protein